MKGAGHPDLRPEREVEADPTAAQWPSSPPLPTEPRPAAVDNRRLLLRRLSGEAFRASEVVSWSRFKQFSEAFRSRF